MTPEQPNEPNFRSPVWVSQFMRNYGCDDGDTMNMEEVEYILQAAITAYETEATRRGELKAWKEAKKIVDQHIEHFGDDCVFLIDQEFNSRIQQYGTKE